MSPDETTPELISGPVSDGDVKLEFRQYLIIGPDSREAAKAALAAGEQDRYWNYVTLFYRNQGVENSGYVTDDFLESVAKGAGVPDLAKWNQDRDDPKWDEVLSKSQSEAQARSRFRSLVFCDRMVKTSSDSGSLRSP